MLCPRRTEGLRVVTYGRVGRAAHARCSTPRPCRSLWCLRFAGVNPQRRAGHGAWRARAQRCGRGGVRLDPAGRRRRTGPVHGAVAGLRPGTGGTRRLSMTTHHPTEVEAKIRVRLASSRRGAVTAVFQPHSTAHAYFCGGRRTVRRADHAVLAGGARRSEPGVDSTLISRARCHSMLEDDEARRLAVSLDARGRRVTMGVTITLSRTDVLDEWKRWRCEPPEATGGAGEAALRRRWATNPDVGEATRLSRRPLGASVEGHP